MLGHRAANLLATVAAAMPDTRVDPGLTTADLDGIERRFGFEFADDHRSFLATVLPVGPGWPDWRAADDTVLRTRLARPVAGVLLDVEQAGFWVADWGERPAAPEEALAVARRRLASVPQLVPVHGRHHLPSGRGAAGHAVVSVHRSDVAFSGTDLVDYVHQEFRAGPGIGRTDVRWRPRATVPFWRDLLDETLAAGTPSRRGG